MYFLDQYGSLDYSVRYLLARVGTEGAHASESRARCGVSGFITRTVLTVRPTPSPSFIFFVLLPQKKYASLSLVKTARLGFEGCEVPRRGSASGPKNDE
jgi:hypothetical protein